MIETYLLAELSVFAQTGTLTKTATQLHVTQPSVTRGMQKLEDEFAFSYLIVSLIVFNLRQQVFLQRKKQPNC